MPLNLLAAFGLGLLIALVTVFVLESAENVIRLPQQIRDRLGLSEIGSIPKAEVGKNESLLDTLTNAQSSVSEAYMSARTALGFATAEGAPRSLLITSSGPAEGKSTTAVGLAFAFARANKRVLLIDGDLRRPRVHSLFDIRQTPGFSEVLSNQAELATVVITGVVPNLDVITSGSHPPDPAGLLSGPMLVDLIREAARRYDLVIIDSPPVMGIADAAQIATACEAVLFVVQANDAKVPQIKLAILRLRTAGANIIGALLTKFDPKSEGYGGAYGYAYNYKYSTKS